MSTKSLTIKNLMKIYPSRGTQETEVHAVDDISLDIKAGEFITLLGPSGCGKTTTLRMIAGFEKPSSGEILLGDQVREILLWCFRHMLFFPTTMFGIISHTG